MTALWIGTSGWAYPHWRERFYPAKLPAREHLSFYASRFISVELNNSFYRQPAREQFEAWARQVPAGFRFAVKASRYITHIQRLAVEPASIERLVDAARGLADKLGPILFQFPPQWECDLPRLQAFLPILPTGERYVFEFRHPSWLTPSVCEVLGAHRAALCIPDHPQMPQRLELTTDFAYVRMHTGAQGPGYSRAALAPWAERIQAWRQRGIEVYVYFNNDAQACATRDAQTLLRLVQPAGEAREGRDSNPGSGLKARSSA